MMYTFEPIGVVRCGGQYKFEAPRQGVFSTSQAVIELESCFSGDAVADLNGFERIWVIFVFDRNLGMPWKAKAAPPFTAGKRKYSLFATRSPYRPNPIGMSCVQLEKIEGRKIYISGHDLLDNTPVLDIKPYIPEADAFPDAAAGWRDEVRAPEWRIVYTEVFRNKAEFLREAGAPDMMNVCEVQLVREPLDASRRRIFQLAEENGYEIGCRTWRLRFRAEKESSQIIMLDIRSNYRPDELLPEAADRYADKEMHRKFIRKFS